MNDEKFENKLEELIDDISYWDPEEILGYVEMEERRRLIMLTENEFNIEYLKYKKSTSIGGDN